LTRFHLLYGLRRGPRALGTEGVDSLACLGPYADRYEELDVSCTTGRSHDIMRYLDSHTLVGRLVALMFTSPSWNEPLSRS
jgi:hypothetical protein